MSPSKAVRNWLSAALIAVLTTSAGFVAGCGNSGIRGIKIGAVLPLTGDAAEYGIDERDGMLLAAEMLNSNRPKSGQISVQVEDSRSATSDGVSGYKKLLESKPDAVLSTLSGVSMAIAPLAEEAKVPLLTVAAHPDLTKGRRYVVRMLPTSVFYARELSRFIAAITPRPTVAVLYANDDFGSSLDSCFRDAYRGAGGTVLSEQGYDKGQPDYRSVVTKALSGKPVAIFAVGYGKDLGMVVRELRKQGFLGTIYSTPEISYPDVSAVAGKALDGTVFVFMWVDEADSAVSAFAVRYEKKYGRKPSLDSYLGFDEVCMVNAAKENKASGGRTLRDALFALRDFPGLTGKLSVLENGDVQFPLVLKVIKDGKASLLER
jgi:branched-chain amino acid transport system substrate-binding protein